MSDIDGIGMYDGVDINTIHCKYIPEWGKTVGSCICECLDFPRKCLVCFNNKYKETKNRYVEDKRKHHFRGRVVK